MRNPRELFEALGKSTFRQRFRLAEKERTYLDQRGLSVILEHARDFVMARLSGARPRNDGKQTPMRGHPAFIAQHATATCCRRCLAKWHFIAAGVPLSDEQIGYVLEVIEQWLTGQLRGGDSIV